MRNWFVLPVFVLILASCASGPSKEELEAQAAKKAAEKAALEAIQRDNAKKLMDMFVDEIWSKTPKQLAPNKIKSWPDEFEAGEFHSSQRMNVKHLKSLGELVEKCTTEDERKHPSPHISSRVSYYQKFQKITVKVRYGFKQSVYEEFLPKGWDKKKLYCGNFTFEDLSNYSFETPSIDALQFKELLKARGVPLVFCHKEKSDLDFDFKESELDHTQLCTLTQGQSTTWVNESGRKYYQPPDRSFSVTTKKGNIKQLYLIVPFNNSEWNTPLSEIVFKRFQDPKEIKKTAEYHDLVVYDNLKSYKKWRAKRAADQRELNELTRAYERKLSKGYHQAFGEALSENVQELNNSNIGLSNPTIKSAGNISYQGQKKRLSPQQMKEASIDMYIPEGQPKIAQIRKSAIRYCQEEGGSFSTSRGVCDNPRKVKCLKQGHNWKKNYCEDPAAFKPMQKFVKGPESTIKESRKKVDISRISCVSPYAERNVQGAFYPMLKGGSVAAGGPFCQSDAELATKFRKEEVCSRQKKGVKWDDIQAHGKDFCEKIRGMSYAGTEFTGCNCGQSDVEGTMQCRTLFTYSCR